MLAFEEARARVLSAAPLLGIERVFLPEALDRVLAEPLLAPWPLPRFSHSAMDGYAVRSADFGAGLPLELPVVGESKTGSAPPELAQGHACRIFTGARMPLGADAVVMQEDTEQNAGRVRFGAVPVAGQHVRKAGEDLAAGSTALEAGTRLGAFQLGLAAALNQVGLSVRLQPRVTIVCTGDELRLPGEAQASDSIPDSNGIALAALVKSAGGIPKLAPLTGDDAAATKQALANALESSDLVLTVGGVSVGDYDLVRPALEALGVNLDFWKVAIKPGKPLVLGRAGRTPVLGLPGNPISAQVTFALFGMPLLRKMQGDLEPFPEPRIATLTQPVRQTPGRRAFLRALLSGDNVTPLKNQASGALPSTAWANALLVVPEDAEALAEGSRVRVHAFADL